MRHRTFLVLIVTLGALLSPRAALAQALADRVPADSFVYLGWKGLQTHANGYEGSHLQAVVVASNFKAAFDDLLPQLVELMAREDPEAKEHIRTATAIITPFLRHRSAIFVRPGVSTSVPVRAGVICHAGADAKSLAGELNTAFAKAPESKGHVRVIESGEFVSILLGYNDADAQAAQNSIDDRASALAGNTNFAAAMKNVPPDPFVSLYVDAEAALALINKAVEQEDPAGAQQWAKIRDASGINGLRRIAIAGWFESKDWTTATFVDAPVPRKALVKLFEGRPIEAEVMKVIPSTAVSAQVARFDVAALAKEVRNLFSAANGAQGEAMFDNAMNQVQQATGVDPIKEVLEPLGDTWIAFSDESYAGNEPTGMLFINKLDDAAAAEKSLSALWTMASDMFNARAPAAARAQFGLSQKTVGGVKVASLEAPTLSINWTVHGGRLIVGFAPDAVAKAATADKPEKGFDQNAQYQALAKRLSDGNAITSFRYSDLTVTAPIMHQQYSQMWQMGRMIASGQGIKMPETVLPPVEVLKSHVAPTATVSWTDAAGFHSRAISPFPGADVFSNAPNGTMTQVGAGALGVSILLPSLNRARETANRVKCASNERQIAQSILLYCNAHNGEYPPDLGTLILTQEITLYAFICPSSNNELPSDANMTPEQMAAWVNEHGDYVYAGKGLNNNTTPADRVIIYEKLDDHARDGINMVYGDGHVEFQLMSDAKKIIEGLKDK